MTINVYGKPSCPKCDMAKALLARSGVDYEYIDLTQDQDAMDMVKSKGAKEAPFVMKGDNVIGGFTELQGYLKETSL